LSKIQGNIESVALTLTTQQYILLLDLVPELTSFAEDLSSTSPEANETVVPSTESNVINSTTRDVITSVQFIMKNMSLELKAFNKGAFESISIFQLQTLEVDVSIASDDSITAEVSMAAFTIADSRPRSKNLFREVMPAMESKNSKEFVINYTKSATNDQVLLTSLNKPKLILVVEHIFALKSFFLDGYESSRLAVLSPPPYPTDPLSVIPAEQTIENSGSFSFRVNLEEAEILLLQDAQFIATEAIVLSIRQVIIAKEGIFSATVSEFGIYLRRMDQDASSKLQFVENFDMTFTLDTRSRSPAESLTAIVLDVQSVVFRISYKDMLLALGILNKVAALQEQSVSVKQTPSTAKTGTVEPSAPKYKSEEIGALKTEQCTLNCDGFQLVLIDDLANLLLPMFDVNLDKFTVNVDDWSDALKLSTSSIHCLANQFNVKNSHWEPLIEPWSFGIEITNKPVASRSVMQIKLESKQRLELNITNEFIGKMIRVQTLWNKQAATDGRIKRDEGAPYTIRNRTGCAITLWSESNAQIKSAPLVAVKDKEEIPWRFTDWREMRETTHPVTNRLAMQINGPGWETLRNIPVDKEGTFALALRPSRNGIQQRVICDVKLHDTAKQVTFRSAFTVVNEVMVDLDVLIVDQQGAPIGEISKLLAGEESSIPIEAAYKGRVRVKPGEGFGYKWSRESITWQQLRSQGALYMTCPAVDGTAPDFRLKVESKNREELLTKNDVAFPDTRLIFCPPLVLENLLPYDLIYKIFDRNSRQEFQGSLAKGFAGPIHTVDLGHLLGLSIELPNMPFRRSDISIINNVEADAYLDDKIVLQDEQGQKLSLKLVHLDIPAYGGAKKISIFSPYVIQNVSGIQLQFRAKSLVHSTKLAAGQLQDWMPQTDAIAIPKPLMFSFSTTEAVRSRCLIRSENTEWSHPLTLDAVGTANFFVVPGIDCRDLHLVLSISEGEDRFSVTKIAKIASRFIIRNMTREELYFRQVGTESAKDVVKVKKGAHTPFHYIRSDLPQQLQIKYKDRNDDWTTAFDVEQIGKVYLKAPRNEGKEEDLLRMEILLENGTMFMIVHKEKGVWPFRIDNRSGSEVLVYQRHTEAAYRIKNRQSMPYTWDVPAMEGKILMLRIENREREINLYEIGPLVPFRYTV